LQFELELLEKRGVLASWLGVNTSRDFTSLTVDLIEAKRQTILKKHILS
jgi:hypothetical protein